LIKDKNARIFINNIGIITDNSIDSSIWINIIQSIEDDRLYFNRCIGLIKSKKNRPESINNNPPGTPKKYSNKQLKEALSLLDKFTYKEISNWTVKSSQQKITLSSHFMVSFESLH